VLLSALHNEFAAVSRFIETLQREQTALVNIDVDQLITISAEKTKQAERLEALAQARATELKAAGVEIDRAQIAAWLESQPREIASAWSKLIEAAKLAQQLNQTNGKLIETQLQNNQQALNTLIGASNQSAVYGADGQARTSISTSQRTLGKG